MTPTTAAVMAESAPLRRGWRVIHSMYGGRGLLQPHNGHWVAAADYGIAIEGAMGGHAKLGFDLPIIGNESFTLWELTPTDYHDAWAYSCTFDKSFR